MRTTFALPSFARSGARSATNSPSRSAVLIIARFTAAVTSDEAAWWNKHHLDPLIVASTLWRKTHPLPAKPQRSGSDESATDLQNIATGKDADGHTAIPARPHDETNPIVPPGSQ